MTTQKWYNFFYHIVRIPIGIVYPIKVYGKENIPDDGALVCANHSSAIDPFFIAFALGAKHQIRPMAKESLLKIPVIGKILSLIGTFGVKRGSADINAIKFALKELNNKSYVAIFPEGTRIKSIEDSDPKTGAAMLACKTGVNVLPIYIPMKKKKFRINRVYIDTPYKMVPAGKRATNTEYDQFTAELMQKIYAMGEKK